eukprot:5120732-Alexandrium_andersonii.AAC.1
MSRRPSCRPPSPRAWRSSRRPERAGRAGAIVPRAVGMLDLGCPGAAFGYLLPKVCGSALARDALA